MRKFKRTVLSFLIIAAVCVAAVFTLNFYIINKTGKYIYTRDAAEISPNVDCILILGAGVRNGKPTPMLRDRLLTGIKLYESGAAEKIIMSGDHGSSNYDEVNIMRSFALENGVPEEDIFMDHAGFSTYDSIYRAKNIFGVKSAVIVSQKYHLYRAVYIAECLGVKAVGVSSDLNRYGGQPKRELREILARNKDFFKCLIKPESKYLGDKIPISGDGRATI